MTLKIKIFSRMKKSSKIKTTSKMKMIILLMGKINPNMIILYCHCIFNYYYLLHSKIIKVYFTLSFQAEKFRQK